MFVDYNVSPVMLMIVTAINFSVKEIKNLEDHKKLKKKLTFYVFDNIISKSDLSNMLRQKCKILKDNNIWFSLRPAAFTDSVANYVAENLSSKYGYNNYIYMTIQTRDYALKTKELILYHKLNEESKIIVQNIFNCDVIDDENTIKISL